MAAAMNKIMIFAAIITLQLGRVNTEFFGIIRFVIQLGIMMDAWSLGLEFLYRQHKNFQAGGQLLLTSLGLLQYFCVIDFLVELPLLVFIRILYFHNPNTCGVRINIGQVVDGMANQAFVLLTDEPFTVTRTFIVNTASLGLSVLWMITCIGLLRGGANNKQSKPVRWPWIIITVLVCSVDLVATVTYANDSFHTRTLSYMMDFIGGVASGTGSIEVDTVWVAWVMVLLYSRFGVIFFINLILLIMVILDGSKTRTKHENTAVVEAPTMVTTEMNTNTSSASDKFDDDISLPSETPAKILPRPGLRHSFRQMKARLFREPSPAVRSLPNSLDVTPERSPRVQHVEIDKKRQVNFPENLLSLPQRLENLIAEQQRRLDKAVIDTSGRHSPPRASQSMPHLATASQDATRGRRGTAAELQGQLPWAYIPASGHPMRDQLPPDEDLPPVPLPDYTAIPSFRKASVHRATSSLSSWTHKKEYKSQFQRPPLTQSDVLY